MPRKATLNSFEGRSLVIATNHKKENAISPQVTEKLGVVCFVPDNFNTDEFGTFTGETERKDDPLETARKKCQMAMAITNYDLAIASEGSFGPHPILGFVHCDDEFLLFIDKKNDLEIWVRELSTMTNFNARYIQTETELKEFANETQFPSHGLILRRSENDAFNITKGITDWETLKTTFLLLKNNFGSVYAETDMRAMHNPTRMIVIEEATKKLVAKISSCCPACQTPGFGITEIKPGLPCSQCGFPTKSSLASLFQCKKCHFIQELKFPNGKKTEDPMYCDHCNH